MTDLHEPLFDTTISALRRASLPDRPENNVPFVPGIYLSWDAKEGAVDIELGSAPGALLTVNARVERAPRWFGLNLSLGKFAFSPGDVLGAVFGLQGAGGETFPVFVRSAVEGENLDTVLRDTLAGSEEPSVQSVLHTVVASDPMGRGSAAFHTLVLRLPPRDFSLTLREMQVFRIPAASGLRSTVPTLDSSAV